MPEGPALSATSDAPVSAPPDPPPATDPPPDDATPPPADPPADVTGEAGDGEPPPADGTPPAAAKPRQTASERFSEMSAARKLAEERQAAADARADKLANTLEASLKALAELTPKPAVEQPAAPEPRPQRDTFADPDSYDTALIEWAARLATQRATADLERRATEAKAADEAKTAALQHAAQQAELQKQQEALLGTWQERRAKAIEAHPDFAEIAESDTLQVPMTMVPALMMADNGPEVLYHLGKHPEEATRIAALNPLQAAIEVGKISAALVQASRATPTRLAPPPKPVGARNDAGAKDPNEMTTEEYAAQRLPKLQSERRATMWGTRPN